ncbi:MAG: polymer-forming cytoskeletal protein [Actinobacteria bacterium]|nr:polymer-forming cytoskeletal protein [Actinomycetota bacterium]
MPKKLLIILVALLSLLCLAVPAGAMEFYKGDAVTLPEGKVEGPVFVTGNSIVINADVDGDVFAAGQTVTVNGKIDGDLLAAGNVIRINGAINGDARVAASSLTVGGQTAGSLTAAASEIQILAGSRINRDMVAAMGGMTVSGKIGRHLLGAGENIFLNSPVGGNVKIPSVGSLKVGPEGAIAGSLSYGSRSPAEIDPGADIGGAADWNQILTKERPQHREGINWLAQLAWFASGVLVWGIFTLLFPPVWSTLSQTIAGSPWASLGWGVLALLTTPLAALLLLITVVGIPVSLALMFAYAALLYAGKIIAGDAAGRFLSRRFGWENKVPGIVPFMIGLAGLILLANIPIVGTIISIAVIALAMGTVSLALYNWRKRSPAPAVGE